MSTIKWFLLLLAAPLLVSCGGAPTAPVSSTAGTSMVNDQAPPAVSPVKQIVLPHDEPDFPYGEGRELFIARCTVCHSLRYVTMQPDFPAKTWSKEVDKMIKTYGAHITEPEAKQISHYLATIKGTTPKGQGDKNPSAKDPNTKEPNSKDPTTKDPSKTPMNKDAGAIAPAGNNNGAASSK